MLTLSIPKQKLHPYKVNVLFSKKIERTLLVYRNRINIVIFVFMQLVVATGKVLGKICSYVD